MEQRSVGTTEEALQYTPGVVSDYYGPDNRNDCFQIRGFQATTYCDGITLSSIRVCARIHSPTRAPKTCGANSTLLGPANPGGSVNFVSKKPRFEKFAEAYVTGGSYNHAETGIDLSDAPNADKTVTGRFTAKVQNSHREYDRSEDDSRLPGIAPSA